MTVIVIDPLTQAWRRFAVGVIFLLSHHLPNRGAP